MLRKIQKFNPFFPTNLIPRYHFPLHKWESTVLQEAGNIKGWANVTIVDDCRKMTKGKGNCGKFLVLKDDNVAAETTAVAAVANYDGTGINSNSMRFFFSFLFYFNSYIYFRSKSKSPRIRRKIFQKDFL